MLTLELKDFDSIADKFEALNPVLSKQLYKEVADYIVEQSQQRIEQQTDLKGIAFKPRSDNTPKAKRRKKMLIGLAKEIKALTITDKEVAIGFATKDLEVLAAKHQYGYVEKFEAEALHSPRKNRKAKGKKSWNIPIPARSFLGVTDEDKQEIIKIINTEIKKALAL